MGCRESRLLLVNERVILFNKWLNKKKPGRQISLQSNNELTTTLPNTETFSNSTGEVEFSLNLKQGYNFMRFNPDDFVSGGDYWKYMDAYFQSLDKLHKDIKKQGSQMLLVWIPSKERVYLPLASEELLKKYVTNTSGEINGIEKSIQRYTQEQGISFLDLTPPLIKEADNGKKMYFTTDGHLNKLGNQVVGELSSEAIIDLLDNEENNSSN